VAEAFSNEFLAGNLFASEAECRARLLQRRTNFSQMGADELAPTGFVLEANRLICEALMHQEAIPLHRAEAARLSAEAQRLDEVWRRDRAADPVGVVDFQGRDASQQQLRSDARRQLETAHTKGFIIADLQAEADRLLRLAIKDFGRFDPQSKRTMLMAADADGEKSLQEGFRDLLPQNA
jgi:DNA-binding response OmpR family regulator